MNILLIEDEPSIKEVYLSVFKEYGHTVTCVADGEEALNLIRANYYDGIYTGVIMPKIDGLQLLKTLSDEKLAHGPVVICSTQGSREIIANAYSLGAKAYFVSGLQTPSELAYNMLTIFKNGLR